MNRIEAPALRVNIAPAGRVRTPVREFWRKFRKQKLAMWAGVFVLLLVLVAIAARGSCRSIRKLISTTTR